MEEKIYKIKVNTTNSLVKNDYFIVKNLDDLKKLFKHGKKNGERIKAHNYTLSHYTISEDIKNIGTICRILIDLNNKEKNYNNCIKFFKDKIIEQYEDEKGADRFLGFKINDELQKIALEEYKIEDFRLDIFCNNPNHISEELYKIVKIEEKTNINTEMSTEDETMELEDLGEPLTEFVDNIEKQEASKNCTIF